MKNIVYLGLIFILYSCTSNIPFDKGKWNEKIDFFYTFRKQMINDLANNHLNSGMDKNAIINLLGAPTYKDTLTIDEVKLVYEIYEDYGWDIDPIETQYLFISFKKDSTLNNAYLETWKHKRGIEKKELFTK